MFSSLETIFSRAETVVEVPETMFSGVGTIVWTIQAMFFVVQTIVGLTQKHFSEAETIFYASKTGFSMTEKTAGEAQSSSRTKKDLSRRRGDAEKPRSAKRS